MNATKWRAWPLSFLFLLLLPAGCKKDPHTYALIETEYGDIKIMLYNTTPKHRDNFIKLVSQGFYDGLLFHRIVERFMIQGGDPDSGNADPNQILGSSDMPYQIVPEIGAPHLRGAVAAAQKSNPQKLSSGCQFYIVVGDTVTLPMLDLIEKEKNIRYNDAQRKLYQEIGGAPWLDNDYTVFGEVVKGMEVVEKISKEPQGLRNRPLQDVVMKKVKIL
jgi:cyclophilin family peptidyl-prolyl cis-trans isomerase